MTLKVDEPGLLALPRRAGYRSLPSRPSNWLSSRGIETPSERVRSKIGIPAVAEPSALRASGASRLLVTKQKGPGVTVRSPASPRGRKFRPRERHPSIRPGQLTGPWTRPDLSPNLYGSRFRRVGLVPYQTTGPVEPKAGAYTPIEGNGAETPVTLGTAHVSIVRAHVDIARGDHAGPPESHAVTARQ